MPGNGFALGKAHEDRQDYETSFAYYDRGNALKRHQTRYKSEQMTAELAAQAQYCTPALFEAQAGNRNPVFDDLNEQRRGL